MATGFHARKPTRVELMTDPGREILTLDEVSVYLKAGRRTEYRLALAEKVEIPAFKLGGTCRFRRWELKH
jgi:excisionase family DNA binding protein